MMRSPAERIVFQNENLLDLVLSFLVKKDKNSKITDLESKEAIRNLARLNKSSYLHYIKKTYGVLAVGQRSSQEQDEAIKAYIEKHFVPRYTLGIRNITKKLNKAIRELERGNERGDSALCAGTLVCGLPAFLLMYMGLYKYLFANSRSGLNELEVILGPTNNTCANITDPAITLFGNLLCHDPDTLFYNMSMPNFNTSFGAFCEALCEEFVRSSTSLWMLWPSSIVTGVASLAFFAGMCAEFYKRIEIHCSDGSRAIRNLEANGISFVNDTRGALSDEIREKTRSLTGAKEKYAQAMTGLLQNSLFAISSGNAEENKEEKKERGENLSSSLSIEIEEGSQGRDSQQGRKPTPTTSLLGGEAISRYKRGFGQCGIL